ncbi:MAG: hypothetical protein ACRETR_01290, partial [Steroidobacteraceae bacterium]
MSDSTHDAGGGGPPPLDPRPITSASGRTLLLGATGKFRPVNLVWLIWSAFFFIEPLQRNTVRDWLTFAGVYACFLAIYLLLISIRS